MDFTQRKIFKCFHKVHLKLNQSFSRYLDLGCGDGFFTLAIASLLDVKHVYGVDIDKKMVEKAQSIGIKAYLADLNVDMLPFPDGFFDIVSAFDVIEHLWNTDHFIEEVRRVLKL